MQTACLSRCSGPARRATTRPALAAGLCTTDLLARVTAYFKLLGEVKRLQILLYLQEGECSVGRLAQVLGTGASNICGHLSQLAWLGLVEKKPQGNTVYYRLADAGVCALIEHVAQLGTRLPDTEKDTLPRRG